MKRTKIAKITCSQVRILGNGIMAAGFLLLCTSLGTKPIPEGQAISSQAAPAVTGGQWILPAAGALLFAAGFFIKLCLWRCPSCGSHLILCVRGQADQCPCCGCPIREKEPNKTEPEKTGMDKTGMDKAGMDKAGRTG